MGAEGGLHPIPSQILGMDDKGFFSYGEGEGAGLAIHGKGGDGLSGGVSGMDRQIVQPGLAVHQGQSQYPVLDGLLVAYGGRSIVQDIYVLILYGSHPVYQLGIDFNHSVLGDFRGVAVSLLAGKL